MEPSPDGSRNPDPRPAGGVALDPARALEELPAEVAILDASGEVVFGNLAWREGRRGILGEERVAPADADGEARRIDYLRLVGASADGRVEAPAALRAPVELERCVRAVLDGSRSRCRGRVSLPGDSGIRHYLVEVAARREGGAIVAQVDATDLVEEHRNLARRALLDGLTNLLDHQAFHARARGLIANAERHGRTLHVLMIDLNDFKRTNDRFGHHVGDAVLVAIARRLVGSVREGDIVGRLGGDEFAVLTQETRDAGVLTERLEAAIHEPVQVGEALVTPACAIGWAGLPDDGRTIGALLQVADARMYLDKERRR